MQKMTYLIHFLNIFIDVTASSLERKSKMQSRIAPTVRGIRTQTATVTPSRLHSRYKWQRNRDNDNSYSSNSKFGRNSVYSDDRAAPSYEEELLLDRCTVGDWAPVNVNVYEQLNMREQCAVNCENGCGAGHAFYLNPGHDADPFVVCYLVKVEANYFVKLDNATARNSDLCTCGTYIDNEFFDCEGVNKRYYKRRFSSLFGLDDLESLKQECKAWCSYVEVFLIRTVGMPEMVYCMPYKESHQARRRTREPMGQCIRENGEFVCVCGLPVNEEWAPKKRDASIIFEETTITLMPDQMVVDPVAYFSKLRALEASEYMKDHRRHDLLRYIFKASFGPPYLEGQVHHNRNILNRRKSNPDQDKVVQLSPNDIRSTSKREENKSANLKLISNSKIRD